MSDDLSLVVPVSDQTREHSSRWASGELLVDLLDLVRDAIIVRNVTGQIIFWSHNAEALYGWSRAEALGRNVHELLPTRFPLSGEAAGRALHHAGQWSGVLWRQTRDGREVAIASYWAARRAGQTAEPIDLVLESGHALEQDEHDLEEAQRQTVELEQQLEESQMLAEELEHSTEELIDRTAAAETAELRIALVLNSFPDPVILYDTEWRVRSTSIRQVRRSSVPRGAIPADC